MSGMKDTLGDTLFADRYPHVPGHRGVDTSVAAAQSIAPHVSQIAQNIENLIRSRGEYGSTYSEVMASLGLGAPTVSARLRELVLHNRITASDLRRPTPSGRLARVYIARVT